MPSLISKNHLKFKSAEEFVSALESVKEDNAYLSDSFNKELIIKHLNSEARPGSLSGYFFAAKDLISNTDLEVTGGSKFMKGYTPPFNSSVYTALKKEGAFNVVQANLDEFGLGGLGIHSAYGVVPNPIDKTRIVGGSSSGSAYLIQKGLIDFSMASDTGDSARYPASITGIIGFKPSYGFISRYGFFPFCSSMDTPSICASSMDTIAKVFSVVSFPDPKDLCTLKTKKTDYVSEMNSPIKKIKVAVLKDTFWSKKKIETDSYKQIKTKFNSLITKLKEEMNIEVEIINFKKPDLLKLAKLIYSVVAYAESISNYSNLTGLLFPVKYKDNNINILHKNNGTWYKEIVANNRSSFGDEFTFRQIIGKYFVEGENYENIYLQSKKIIEMINDEIEEIFKNFDLIISPVTFDIPEKIKKIKREYSPRNDVNITLLANFCSLPAISIPWETVQGMPIGLHLMSNYARDGFLLNVANKWVNWFKCKK